MDDSATKYIRETLVLDLSTSLIHIYQTIYNKEENMYKV